MRIISTVVFIFLSVCLFAQPSKKTIIAFGSCDDEDKPQDMWKEIIAQHPTLWIWGGDNIYAADGEHGANLLAQYNKQKSNADYQELLKNCAVTGTWDDHDYASNDGGRFFSKKEENKKPLLEFLGMKKENPVWHHSGVYNSIKIGSRKQKVKVINLDTRSFRDTTYKVHSFDSLTNKATYHFYINKDGDILGDEQWHWLEQELGEKGIALFIINSSIQVISENHRFEKWGNFPKARQRLFDLIAASKKNVLIISGDRHIAEFSQIQLPTQNYPLVDFTDSGLTHTWTEFWDESNTHRVGKLVIEKTFGLIKVEFSSGVPVVELEIRGLQGVKYGTHKILFPSTK